jgi:hypothetical protein
MSSRRRNVGFILTERIIYFFFFGLTSDYLALKTASKCVIALSIAPSKFYLH